MGKSTSIHELACFVEMRLGWNTMNPTPFLDLFPGQMHRQQDPWKICCDRGILRGGQNDQVRHHLCVLHPLIRRQLQVSFQPVSYSCFSFTYSRTTTQYPAREYYAPFTIMKQVCRTHQRPHSPLNASPGRRAFSGSFWYVSNCQLLTFLIHLF